MLLIITDKEAFDKAMKDAGDQLVVVDFTAEWCGPCQSIAPHYKSMSEHLDNRNVVFLKVDVDEVQELAALCGIKCMPTFQFYRHGKKIDEFVGSNKDKLQEMVEKHK
ncbi:thioredoxin b [Scleropages formosus]|uniref:thioredoxin b n=1 Tax=Scleropages formosus TaxID=113540 RepID=UPI000878FB50|nr:thioredoxin-like [Scleropages formosus]